MNPARSIGMLRLTFAAVGLALVGGALYWTEATRSFVLEASTARGEVVELQGGDTYHPVVRFTASDGREHTFRSSTGSDPPAYDVGESVEVLYHRADPEGARINGFLDLWLGPLIVGGIGSIFLLIGAGMMFASLLSQRRAADLKANGQRIEAKVVSVERNTSLKVNGQSPWRIVAQWQNPATGEMHVFHSDNFWYDPTAFVKDRTIPVWIDRARRARYWVDVSAVPKIAG